MSACVACDSAQMVPHLQVAGHAGPDGLIPTTDRFGAALADIVRCSACGHMQLERFPLEPELAEAYGEAASEDYVDEEAGQRETARRALRLIENEVGRGSLLDLGCWVGFLLAEATAGGWVAKGVEPSEFASQFARDRLGLDVVTGDLFATDLPPAAFRAVILGDVIEHLPDPCRALDRIAGLLEPGGVLWLTLPDAGSRLARAMGKRWWSVIPTHIQYFTRVSLTRLLERHGYEVLRVGTAPKAFSVRYYLERVGGYSPGLARSMVRAAELIGVADRMWAPDFRDRMYLIARSGSSVLG